LINPYGHDPQSELPHTPVAGIPLWTEHYTFYGYDLGPGVGVHIHVGRLPADPRIWRAVIQVYLPGEELLVAKYHGRDGDFRGPGAGPFKATCVEPLRLWTMDFDGALFSTSRPAVMREILRDGPAEPVAFHLTLEAAGPLFGRQDDLSEGRTSSTFHSEQICRARGFVSYRGQVVTLDGMGVRDHSSGPRDYGPVVADIWFHGLFPSGRIVQTQVVRFEQAEYQTAYVYRGDGTPHEMTELLEHPRVNVASTPPRSMAADPLMDPDRTFRLSCVENREGGYRGGAAALRCHHLLRARRGVPRDGPGASGRHPDVRGTGTVALERRRRRGHPRAGCAHHYALLSASDGTGRHRPTGAARSVSLDEDRFPLDAHAIGLERSRARRAEHCAGSIPNFPLCHEH
jgi:hypothetical protein